MGLGSSVSPKIVMAVAAASFSAPPAQAITTPPSQPALHLDHALLQKAGDSGINIVRMPQRPVPGRPSAIPATQQTPSTPTRPSEPTQPQGRLLKLQVKLG